MEWILKLFGKKKEKKCCKTTIKEVNKSSK